MERSVLKKANRLSLLLFVGLLSLAMVLVACEENGNGNGTPGGDFAPVPGATPTPDGLPGTMPDPGSTPGVGMPDPGSTPTPGMPDPGSTPTPGMPGPGATPGVGMTDPTPEPMPELTEATATVVEVDTQLLLIEATLEDGSSVTYGVHPDAEITIDGAPGTLEDIQPDDTITMGHEEQSRTIYTIMVEREAPAPAAGS